MKSGTAVGVMEYIVKRDGRKVPYDINKIAHAIEKAMVAGGRKDTEESMRLAALVEQKLFENYQQSAPSVEDIQDTVELVLMENGYAFVAKKLHRQP